MKLIKELGVRNNGKRGYMWGLFECPKCFIQIERMKHQGISQQQCPKCFREYHQQTQIQHGDRYTRLYRTWINMRARCNNPKEPKYKLYGAKGIKICSEWNKYINFKDWALINGYSDNLTIDRINVKGNYEPSNCCFISIKENAGKDKIKISKEVYLKIKDLIIKGNGVEDSYKSFGFSRSAYYGAKERYENNR